MKIDPNIDVGKKRLRARLVQLGKMLNSSKLVRQSAIIFAVNAISKGLLIIGLAYAAKCLGPANLGVSAQVQATAKQLALLFNGGLDTVSVRYMATNPEAVKSTALMILKFRLAVSLILSGCWAAYVLSAMTPGTLQIVWLLGPVLLIFLSLNSSFAFQACEILPWHAAVVASGSIVSAAIYLGYFEPEMPLGSDLLLITTITAITAVSALLLGNALLLWRRDALEQIRASVSLRSLLAEGKIFWFQAVLSFVISGLPVLLVGRYSGDVEAGLYRSAFLLAMGLELLFGSVNNLLLPKLVKIAKSGSNNLRIYQHTLLKWYALIGIIVALTTTFFAPFVFRLMGPEYEQAVRIFQIMALSRIVVFIAQIYAVGLVALNFDRAILYVSVVAATASIGLNYVAIPQGGATAAAIVLVISELVLLVGCFGAERVLLRSRSAIG